MKAIFVCAVLLALGMPCLGECEEWKAFMDEIKGAMCKPDTVDDAMLTALIDCKKGAIDEEKMEKIKEIADKMYEKCGTPNEGDISTYTKVTNANNKKALMFYCSENMATCKKAMVDEWRKNNPAPEKGDEGKGKMSDEQKTIIQTCMKKAVGLA